MRVHASDGVDAFCHVLINNTRRNNDRSGGLSRPSETHFDLASVDTYSESSTDLCRPNEEHFDWTLSNWDDDVVFGLETPLFIVKERDQVKGG
ncbi:hypothetical protein QJS10_CPA06g01045 [Acorus calamus]|uniref:Uncharacterized protein n=1 Tax=Acorus calamus TaxID=4465 RepID=A0AAV9ESP0_ACOCL|nr:hypothetical protein QJS10_CPA06g01045 [Acorus calamus]